MRRHLFVIKNGKVTTLYTDKLNLRAIGPLAVERASNVEFDNVRQGWTVTLADGTVLPDVFTSRDEAIAYEVRYIENRMRNGEALPHPCPVEV